MTVAETPLPAATFFDLADSRPHATNVTMLDGRAGRCSPIDAWLLRIHFRTHLKRLLLLDAGLIEDIGLTRQEAEREAAKPFWRP
jgi:uncharacterized protein YjiS (DUF1127 family)